MFLSFSDISFLWGSFWDWEHLVPKITSERLQTTCFLRMCFVWGHSLTNHVCAVYALQPLKLLLYPSNRRLHKCYLTNVWESQRKIYSFELAVYFSYYLHKVNVTPLLFIYMYLLYGAKNVGHKVQESVMLLNLVLGPKVFPPNEQGFIFFKNTEINAHSTTCLEMFKKLKPWFVNSKLQSFFLFTISSAIKYYLAAYHINIQQ